MGIESSQPQSQFCPSYGYHQQVKCDDAILMQKQYKMQSKHQRNSFQKLLKLLKQIRCDTLLNFQNAFESQDIIIVQFQFISKTLRDQIQQKKTNFLKYQEKEVLNFLDCMISSLILFSYKGLTKRSFKVQNIFIRQHPKKYVISYLELDDGNSDKQGKEATGKDKQIKFMSPQQVNNSSIVQKSNIFSIGLIALHLCLLEPISHIYSTGTINQYQLHQLLSSLSDNYSENFVNLLKQMLTIPLQQRLSLSQTSQLIQQLIENQSSLKFGNSNSKLMSKRIELEREKELEENGIDSKLPTYCFVVQKEFIDELYGGGRIIEKKQKQKERGSLGSSRKSYRAR